MTDLTKTQQTAIECVLGAGAERAVRACDIANDFSEDDRGLYSDENEIIAYGVMPNTNQTGWYFAGYADELAAQR